MVKRFAGSTRTDVDAALLGQYFATVAPPGPPPTTTTFGFACANAGMGNVEAASAPMPPMNCLLSCSSSPSLDERCRLSVRRFSSSVSRSRIGGQRRVLIIGKTCGDVCITGLLRCLSRYSFMISMMLGSGQPTIGGNALVSAAELVAGHAFGREIFAERAVARGGGGRNANGSRTNVAARGYEARCRPCAALRYSTFGPLPGSGVTSMTRARPVILAAREYSSSCRATSPQRLLPQRRDHHRGSWARWEA